MKKIILASTAALIATLGFASASQAGWRHHHHGGYFGGLNIVLDAGPRYVVDDGQGYEGECYIKKTKRYNRYGDLVIRKVRICD